MPCLFLHINTIDYANVDKRRRRSRSSPKRCAPERFPLRDFDIRFLTFWQHSQVKKCIFHPINLEWKAKRKCKLFQDVNWPRSQRQVDVSRINKPCALSNLLVTSTLRLYKQPMITMSS